MKLTMAWKEGMHFQGETPSGHTVDLDSGPAGAKTAGPTPMEVLLQAMATCSGMDIVGILEKKRKELKSFEIDVEGERAESHPKKFETVNIIYKLKGDGLTEKDVEKAVKLSVDKYCSVIAGVQGETDVSWSYEILR